MDGFSYWIFGYQNFAEPIIRECICLKKGWQDVMGKVTTPTIDELLKSLEDRSDWDEDFQVLKECAKKDLSKRKQRMSLDAAFLDEKGNPIIGEFKSWTGFETFTKQRLWDEVVTGRMFPDRLAIKRIYYEGAPIDVTKFVIATSVACQKDKELVWRIGDLTVEVFDITNLLSEFGDQAASNRGSFEQLAQSVKQVKKYIKTGGKGGSTKMGKRMSKQESQRRLKQYETDQLKVLVDDDESYIEWVRNNPLGYVVNSFRKPTTDYLILHRANCRTILEATRGPGNWTTTGFVKICSVDRSVLVKWASTEVGGELQPCQRCKP